jgi:hypothetical protein
MSTALNGQRLAFMKYSRRIAPPLCDRYALDPRLEMCVLRHVAGDDTLPMPMSTHVRRLDASEAGYEGPIDKLAFELVLVTRLKAGDLVLCTAGDVIPADGVVIEGTAEIANGTPLVLRGTRLTSGYIVLRVAA